MEMITTTQLRTQTAILVKALLAGKSVQLIHRAQNIATISPFRGKPAKPFDAKHYLEKTKNMITPSLTKAQMKKNYNDHIMEKYGKYLSGHQHTN